MPHMKHFTLAILAPASLSKIVRRALQTLKERKDAPSNFTLKLRKHIRTRRLEDVRQLGVVRPTSSNCLATNADNLRLSLACSVVRHTTCRGHVLVACMVSDRGQSASKVCVMQDRIIDFTFGTGEATHHIILELYSQVGST